MGAMGPDLIIPIAGMATGALAIGFTAKVITYWIRLHYQSRDELGGPGEERMVDLEARIAALEEAGERLLDVEERVEFAERLLARRNDPNALPGA
jgi:hypothetical protein